jgi:PhoH-like ATPase
MDDDVKLVTLLGPAGTGKTFLTLLVGLYKVAYERMYRKFLVTRPVIALGADIGYLPGDIQEKLHYWMQPIHDNLEFIFSQMLRGSEEHFNLGSRRDRERKNEREQEQGKKSYKKAHNQENGQGESHTVERLQQKGILSLEAITYMRGRSIPFQFVFIDEVQNLTPHEVKTIVSRAGEGTKVILAGDPYQIDSPYLDFTSNGLTVTADKFKDQSISGTVFLETSERSELAKLAAEIL